MAFRAAVFDVDRTLLGDMTGALFSRYLVRAQKLRGRRRLWLLSRILLHRFGLLQDRSIVELGVLCYAGLPESDLREMSRRCFDEEIRDRLYREAMERIAAHRRDAHVIVLASGSSHFIVEEVGRFVGADHVIGARARIEGGISAGEVVRPLPFRDGKRELVERFLESLGITLDEIVMYSDDPIDLPLLERAGKAVVVNPRAELEVMARARRWTIERWSESIA